MGDIITRGTPDGRTSRQWTCDSCGATVLGGSAFTISCSCGAQYNGFGQRLRDDWAGNPSNWDDEIGDMEGFEQQQLAIEDAAEADTERRINEHETYLFENYEAITGRDF